MAANETLQTFLQHVPANESILAVPANETYPYSKQYPFLILLISLTVSWENWS
jgi:hypothetical protein